MQRAVRHGEWPRAKYAVGAQAQNGHEDSLTDEGRAAAVIVGGIRELKGAAAGEEQARGADCQAPGAAHAPAERHIHILRQGDGAVPQDGNRPGERHGERRRRRESGIGVVENHGVGQRQGLQAKDVGNLQGAAVEVDGAAGGAAERAVVRGDRDDARVDGGAAGVAVAGGRRSKL